MRVIRGATIYDGRGGAPFRADVEVEAGRIRSVNREAAGVTPGFAEAIDGTGLFLLPRLIDAHVHLGGTRTPNPMLDVWVPEGLKVARGVADARRLLEAGFTSVRELGFPQALGIRDAVNEGSIPGPRILTAGRYIEPTGGADDPSFMPLEWSRRINLPRMADGVDAVRRAVREQLREGSDFIKTC